MGLIFRATVPVKGYSIFKTGQILPGNYKKGNFCSGWFVLLRNPVLN